MVFTHKYMHSVRHKPLYSDTILFVILQLDNASNDVVMEIALRFDLPIKFFDACVLIKFLTTMPAYEMYVHFDILDSTALMVVWSNVLRQRLTLSKMEFSTIVCESVVPAITVAHATSVKSYRREYNSGTGH